MKGFLLYIPKVLIKLVAMLLSPILHLVTCVYKPAAALLAYGCIGLSLVCLIAIGAEFYYYGITQEAFEYLAIGALGYAARWIILWTVPALQVLVGYIDYRKSVPLFAG